MIEYERKNWGIQCHFESMASSCELLLRTTDKIRAKELARIAFNECKRIENKYSRYLDNNLCYKMNHGSGNVVPIDKETFQLLQYARQLFELSQGAFDITSGVLRKIWHFDHAEYLPDKSAIENILPFIGFDKIDYNEQEFILPENMEIDFGGIGKEYCADRIYQLILMATKNEPIDFLINLGGDIIAHGVSKQSLSWQVGIESVTDLDQADKIISLKQGALATSGTTKRYTLANGEVLGHILNPKTGYPVKNAPRSITILNDNCTAAGSLATLAMLQGENAEQFLESQQVRHWILR